MQLLEQLLDMAGIGGSRMALRWVSAAEGQLFANIVTEITQTTKALGPFDAEGSKLRLAAVQTVVGGPRMRWLTGMDRHVTERTNVYGEKVDEDRYQQLIHNSLKDEYHKALLLEALRVGPLSVHEMADHTGLPVYTVSLRLNDLEKRSLVELQRYEGTTPKFVALAA